MNINVGNGTHWLPWYEQKLKSMATVNCLVTKILQNIFFNAQKKKQTCFWVNYSFKGRRKKKKKKIFQYQTNVNN